MLIKLKNPTIGLGRWSGFLSLAIGGFKLSVSLKPAVGNSDLFSDGSLKLNGMKYLHGLTI